MAEQIIIKTVLDLSGSKQKIEQDLTKILNSTEVLNRAKEAGKKVGESLSLGIKSGLSQSKDEMDRFTRSTQSATLGVGNLRSGLIALGAIRVFKDIAGDAIQAAVAIDRQLNSLKALTGSAEAAQKRFQELFKLAQQTPGLTTGLATTLDAQLRIFRVSEQTINRLLPVIGRLNAISPLGDPRQFVNNLTQLISQNFERQDLKELVGASPIAGQLIAEIFNVDNPTNADAIRKSAKKLGVTTVTRLAEELIREANENPALRNATETLAGQFEKMQDRITVALAPIGDALVKTIAPSLQKLIELIERDGPKIAGVVRELSDEFERTAGRLIKTVDYFGQLVGLLGQLESKTSAFTYFARLADAINPVTAALDAIIRGIRGIEGFFRGGDPNALPPAPPGRTIEPGRLAFGRYGLPGSAPNAPRSPLDIVLGRYGEPPPEKKEPTKPTEAEINRAEAARERVDRFLSRTNIAALEDHVESRLRDLDTVTNDLIKSYNAEIKAREKFSESLERLGDATTSMISRGFNQLSRDNRRTFADAQRDLGRSYQNRLTEIDDLIAIGAIDPVQAAALRRSAAAGQAGVLGGLANDYDRRPGIDKDDIINLRDQADHLERISRAADNGQRFLRGFKSETRELGDAFEKLGQDVASSFRNIGDLLGSLKNAALNFIREVTAQALQRAVGVALAPLAGIFGGGGGIGGPAFAGAAGNIFRTPNTFPSSASAFQSIAQAFGGGISVPASVTAERLGAANLPVFRGNIVNPGGIANASGGVLAGAAGAAGAAKFSFGALGKSLGNLAPFLGLSLGSGVGGQSTFGSILGSAGGLAAGIGISSLIAGAGSAGAFGSVLGLGSIAGPIGLAAAPLLLVGASLLGKAKQRKQDEELSGQYLTQALQAIDELALGVSSGQIPGSQARQLFETNILGTFRQQISTLKTRSVVESRLTNQVRDLQKVYDSRIPPLIAEQERKARDAARFAAIDSRLIPQFAGGGTVPGIDRGYDSVPAMLRPGEVVLNRVQQNRVMQMAGPGVFDRAGVPRSPIYTGGAQAMQVGGYATPIGGGSPGTIVIDRLTFAIDAEGMVTAVMSSRTGERIIVNQIENVNLRKERR